MNVLFLIENVPYELDSRVRRQAAVVRSLGGSAIVICPRGESRRSQPSASDGVIVYRYFKPAMGAGLAAHLLEYLFSLVLQSLLAAYVCLRHGFDVIHVANPPDLLWLVAVPFKLFGKRYIFDHHDLVPELYGVRYRSGLLYRLVVLCERCSIRFADHVISTNETFKGIATSRGRKSPDDVTVVRNGPWLETDFSVDPSLPADAPGYRGIVIGYLGIMNPQDQLENLLEAIKVIRHDFGRCDIFTIAIGSGDSYPSLLRLRDQLGLSSAVYMPGTLPWSDVLGLLQGVTICVQPDMPTAFNVHLTMNKLMEYMALGKPTVAYDMHETAVTGGDAIHYVKEPTTMALARALIDLADDPERRQRLGGLARDRVERVLCWERQRAFLVEAYQRVMQGDARSSARTGP